VNPFPNQHAKHLYARKIKETTNGGWHGACRETRKALEVIAQRRITANGALDE